MGKLVEVNNQIEELRDVSNEAYKNYETTRDEQDKKISRLQRKRETIKRKFEEDVRGKFKDINITLSHSPSYFKITIDKQFILKHLYDSTKFNNITKKLYKELIKLYEDTYGEVEEGDYTQIDITTTNERSYLQAYNGLIDTRIGRL